VDPERIWGDLAARFAALGASLPPDALLVDDDDLDYVARPGEVLAPRSALLPKSETGKWTGYFAPGRSWVHCNLLRSADGGTVVSLRHGGVPAVLGKPTPVNISVEPAPLTILD
jgi:hypothetical protein